jgi:hypothetical protein
MTCQTLYRTHISQLLSPTNDVWWHHPQFGCIMNTTNTFLHLSVSISNTRNHPHILKVQSFCYLRLTVSANEYCHCIAYLINVHGFWHGTNTIMLAYRLNTDCFQTNGFTTSLTAWQCIRMLHGAEGLSQVHPGGAHCIAVWDANKHTL